MMKKYTLGLILFVLPFLGSAQTFWGLGPFTTMQGLFKVFQDGLVRQLDHMAPLEVQVGDNVIGFIANNRDLRVYDGKKVTTLSGLVSNFQVSDNFIALQNGPILSVWQDGKGQWLTNFGRRYVVTDSLLVFEDTQMNSVRVWYNGTVQDLYTVIGDIYLPRFIGDNVLAFEIIGGTHYIFHSGKMYEIDTYRQKVEFSCGRDIAAFNDPLTRTFAIYENGQFFDLEEMHAVKFQAGIKCITYIDQNQNMWYYRGGKKQILANFSPDYWDANDHCVVWGEGDQFFVWDGIQKVVGAYYRPEFWVIKNSVVAFKNQLGGVDCVIDGKLINITNEPMVNLFISGETVVIELANKNFMAYSNGRKIRS
jgi:hypothetical protein